MILKTLCFTLGIVVREECEEKCDESAQVIVSNHISMLDYIPIHILSGCVTVRLCLSLLWSVYNFSLGFICKFLFTARQVGCTLSMGIELKELGSWRCSSG